MAKGLTLEITGQNENLVVIIIMGIFMYKKPAKPGINDPQRQTAPTSAT